MGLFYITRGKKVTSNCLLKLFSKKVAFAGCVDRLCGIGLSISNAKRILNHMGNYSGKEEGLLEQAEIPHIPSVISKIIEISSQKDFTVKKIANEIKKEPSLVAQILKIANSPYYSLSGKVSTLDRAISVLGTTTVQSIALSAGIFNTLYSDDASSSSFDLNSFWKRTIFSSMAAQLLAKEKRYPVPEEAFILGLLHDIGILAMAKVELSAFEDICRRHRENAPLHPALFIKHEEEQFGTNHAKIGAFFAKSGHLPQFMEESIFFHHTPGKYKGGSKKVRSMIAFLFLADILADIFISGEKSGALIRFKTMSRRVGGFDEKQSEEILFKINEEAKKTATVFDEISVEPQKDYSEILSDANRELGNISLKLHRMNRLLQNNKAEIYSMNSQLKKAKKKAERSSHHKTKFLADMSHEIRTPMNGIIGFADILLEGNLNAEQRDSATIIKNSAASLLEIINGILDISKIEAGRLTLEETELDVRQIASYVCSITKVRLENSPVELFLNIQADVPKKLIGDQVRLQQVITNLLGNACKFTAEGKILLNISALESVGDCVTLQFSVQDTGIGIPENKHNSIFDPFTQADASTKREFGGTGLGLSISKNIVKIMGGRMWLVSKIGGGSTFSFTANFQKVSVSAKEESATCYQTNAGQAEHDKIRDNMRILLAEDNFINQKLILKMLDGLGCVIDIAKDGVIAKEKAGKQAYDLILMDVQMPNMSGIEATMEIRKMHNDVPIVAITADAMSGDKERCIKAGMNDYLTKPISKEDVLAKIRKFSK